jgi:replication-associated recombination protein RarA
LRCTNCDDQVNTYHRIIKDKQVIYRLCDGCFEHNKYKIESNTSWTVEEINNSLSMSDSEEAKKAIADLNNMIGLNHIKEQVKSWMEELKGRQILTTDKRLKIETPPMHMIITGNPGTGKTEVARKIATLLHVSGFIPKNKFTEVQPHQLIGKHVGHTAPKTQAKIDDAMGGVFFLDEAYQLASEGLRGNSSAYGQEALETIMSSMENNSGRIVFIFAGYEDKIKGLLEMNQGMRSRIPYTFKLNDYTPSELKELGKLMLESKGYDLSKAEEALFEYIDGQVDNGVLEGNARTVRIITEKVISNHMIRIGKKSSKNLSLVIPEDIWSVKSDSHLNEKREGLSDIISKAKTELNELVGLTKIKQEMNRLVNYQAVQERRKAQGLKVHESTNHMMFSGSPGTGKTTVARIVGKLLRGVGALSNGHLVEVTKDDLVTSQGKATKNVKKAVEKALGGILFVDEAYTLSTCSEGREALDMLIKEMEENRKDFVVIFAGYTDEMKGLSKLNSGFASRVPHQFVFEDYKQEELTQIACKLIDKSDYMLSCDARFELAERISELNEDGLTGANGRWVRNLFERILIAQSQRIIEKGLDDLQTIEEYDVMDAVSEMECGVSRRKSEKNSSGGNEQPKRLDSDCRKRFSKKMMSAYNLQRA